MIDLREAFVNLAFGDRLLVLLIVASLAFVALSVGFAGTALFLRWKNLQKARRWGRFEKRWESQLLGLLDGEITVEAVRRSIRRGDQRYFIDYLTRFSRRVRGTERELLANVAKPFLPRIVRQLRSRQAATRARAVRTLSLLGLNTYASRVIGALDDRAPVVAMTAARELSRSGHPAYTPSVLSRLANFRDWSHSFLTAMLVSIGPQAAPFLRETFVDSRKAPRVRAMAASALRGLNDLATADLAAKTLTHERNRDVVAAALRLLRQCGTADHADAVRPLAQHADELIRAQALSALGTLGEAQDLPTLAAALEDPSIWVASHAARALLTNAGTTLLEQVAQSGHPRADVARQVLIEASA